MNFLLRPVRPLRRGVLAAGLVLCWLTSIVLIAEGALHIPADRRSPPEARTADALAASTASHWREVQTSAADGVTLRAWLFTPEHPNGGAVLLLHGIADTRRGALGAAPFLLRHGYTVLAPDSRGHGTSGGGEISYGLREARDVHDWVNWLCDHTATQRLYALGESYGASVLLQATATEPRLRAVVAECPFAAFPLVARDRLSAVFAYKPVVPALVSGLLVKPAFLYAQWRYGLHLDDASPAAALAGSQTPVLLIHGLADRKTRPQHSEALHRIDPDRLPLWEVPRAGHTMAFLTQPEEFERRVLAWFAQH